MTGRRRATVYLGEAPPQRPWPPRPLLMELLATGTDVQIAELLGRSRGEVRWQRQVLAVEHLPHGGSVLERWQRRAEFAATWQPRLAALGLAGDVDADGARD